MRIASSSTQIVCHDWPNGDILNTYKPINGANCSINTISWAKNVGWILLSPKVGKAEIISFDGPAKFITNINIQHQTCACFQNLTKRNITIGTNTGNILVYDVKTKNIKKTFQNAPSPIFKVEYTLKDTHVIAGCDNGELRIYNNNSALLACNFKVQKSKTLTNFRSNPIKRNLLAGCSQEGIITTWDINKSMQLTYMDIHKLPVTDIAYSSKQPNVLICTGMDKRICLTDANCGKITADIKCEKVPTAIDFSNDGLGFAVGFQDGSILGYDLRNMNENIIQFCGHRTRIYQIVFEKDHNDGTSSIISLPEEPQQTQQVTNDSITNLYCGDVLELSKNNVTRSSEYDSFMNAMSLDESAGGLVMTDSAKKMMLTRSSVYSSAFQQVSPSYCLDQSKDIKTSQIRTHVEIFKGKCSSTPLAVSKEFESNISPITNDSKTIKQSFVTECSVRQIVKEALKEEIEEIKKEMKYRIYDILGDTRRQFLDLQMSIIKESLRIEDSINLLREELQFARK